MKEFSAQLNGTTNCYSLIFKDVKNQTQVWLQNKDENKKEPPEAQRTTPKLTSLFSNSQKNLVLLMNGADMAKNGVMNSTEVNGQL